MRVGGGVDARGGGWGEDVFVGDGVDGRRLVEHRGDDLFETFGTQAETSCEGQVLAAKSFFFFVVIHWVVRTASGFEHGNFFGFTSGFVFFLVVLRSAAVLVI